MNSHTTLLATLSLLLPVSVSSQVKPEKRVAELTFAVPDQGEQTLLQFRGKVMALELISTGCLACENSVRILSAIQKEFGTGRFQALAIAVNPNAEVSTPEFTREQNATFPIGFATREQARKLLDIGPEDRFALPQILLLDTKGQIRYRTAAIGSDPLRTEAALRQRIQVLLNPAPAPSKTESTRENAISGK
ncbi:MAG: TlpA disulfide reductase family protein [Bryobacteraceae bacterium]